MSVRGEMAARGQQITGDLRRIFGARLQSLVAYGWHEDGDDVHTLALVDGMSFQDLAACVPLVPGWRRVGFDVPLLLSRHEFLRTLDVFPLEYGGIIASHIVLWGADPFGGMEVRHSDLRRACEQQAKSHLIHLREGFLENGREPRALARMIASSAAPLRSLIVNLERLDADIGARAGLTPELQREIATADAIADPSALLARYVAAVERLWREVDGWS